MDTGRQFWFSALRRLLSAKERSLEITTSGWIFVALTLLVGFAAINSGSNLLHALFGAQMALIVGSGILSERTINRMAASRTVSSPVFACTPTRMQIQLHNRSSHDVFSVAIEEAALDAHAPLFQPVFAVHLASGQTTTMPTTLTMPTRGVHALPDAVVATRFPFGLFVKRKHLRAPPPVLVYPRVHDVPVPVPPNTAGHRGEDGALPARVGEFRELRQYREGDDASKIHWPSLARRAVPLIREHEAEGGIRVVLDLDPGRTGDPTFERSVEQVASGAVAYLRVPGIAVGLRISGTLVAEPAEGPTGQHRVLEALALAGGEA